MVYTAWLFVASLVVLGSSSPISAYKASSNAGPLVVTSNGTIQGIYSQAYSQDFFLGVPYAQPPIDELRFRNPVSLNSTFNGVFQATAFPPQCVGFGSDSDGRPQSEDCLYLNVVRPSGYENTTLPVAVWFHGGALVEGGIRDPRYNLSYIVGNSVNIGKPFIAVAVAYRLSAWGFLQSSQVSASGNTNMGLRDQRLALHYVQENIQAFGGDPQRVTIWGESAGAGSVGWHITAYNGRNDNLFRAAIMQSGNPLAYHNYRNTSYYQPYYQILITASGCLLAKDSLECLRNRPFGIVKAAIFATNLLMSWQPIVDGDFIVRTSSQQIADGAFVQVPIIDGANTDEGTAFSPLPVSDELSFLDKLVSPYEPVNLPSDLAAAANAVYPNKPEYWIPSAEMLGNSSIPRLFGDAEEWRRSAAYYGDAYFIANRRGTCQAWAARGLTAYSYRFNTLPAGVPRCIGATHFQEVAFVFNNTQGVGYSTNPFQGMPLAYQQLSKFMASAWTSFIVDLDPNSFITAGSGAPMWPKYSVDRPENMVWDASMTGIAYTEPDTFRQEGIQWILDHADAYQR